MQKKGHRRAKVVVKKADSGQVMVYVTKDGVELELDINECCIISDKVDTFLFGKAPANRRIRYTNVDADLQPMEKEEMHDLLFNHSYLDGSDLTKGLSIKMSKLIDTGKIKTYGDLFNVYGKVISRRSVVKP